MCLIGGSLQTIVCACDRLACGLIVKGLHCTLQLRVSVHALVHLREDGESIWCVAGRCAGSRVKGAQKRARVALAMVEKANSRALREFCGGPRG